jgi:hypothetical protein
MKKLARLGLFVLLGAQLTTVESVETKSASIDVPEVFIIEENGVKEAALGQCSICLDEIQPKSHLKLPDIKENGKKVCGHSFYKNCIQESVKHKAECPLCRTRLLAKDVGLPEEELALVRPSAAMIGFLYSGGITGQEYLETAQQQSSAVDNYPDVGFVYPRGIGGDIYGAIPEESSLGLNSDSEAE